VHSFFVSLSNKTAEQSNKKHDNHCFFHLEMIFEGLSLIFLFKIRNISYILNQYLLVKNFKDITTSLRLPKKKIRGNILSSFFRIIFP
jgi:hypothetical protein